MKKILISLAALSAAVSLYASDFPTGSPKFATSSNVVTKAAKENGKPTILVFSAAWCGPCQAMKKDVYPSAAVKPFHDQFNWAYLDIDVEANNKLSETYKVESIPNIVFLDASGKKLHQEEGGGTPDEFAKLLAKVLKKAHSGKTASAN